MRPESHEGEGGMTADRRKSERRQSDRRTEPPQSIRWAELVERAWMLRRLAVYVGGAA
jgi:hypothetical protein